MPQNPPCSCAVTSDNLTYDPACPYHGDEGTMVVKFPIRTSDDVKEPMKPTNDNQVSGALILLLDARAHAGRTGHHLNVKSAQRIRNEARFWLGVNSDDGPTTAEILRAAMCLNALLIDATVGNAKIMVELGGEQHSPGVVLSTLRAS